MKLLKILKGVKPLIVLSNNKLIVSKKNSFFKYDIVSGVYEYIISLPSDIKSRIFSSHKITSRLFRLDIRGAFQIDDVSFFCIYNKKLFIVNFVDKTINEQQIYGNCSVYLKPAKLEGIDGFDDQFVFGEYFSNYQRVPVNIHTWTKSRGWKISYTFPAGTMEHIHAIIPDKFRNGVWILTGDFDIGAAIWYATKNFNKVECVVSGAQIYRSCFAFPVKEGLIYATDSPFSQNQFRILIQKNGKWTSEAIMNIPGPIIYSGNFGDTKVVSTSVEPNGGKGSFFKNIFAFKRGDGILANYSETWVISEALEVMKIVKNKKDMLPFVFQFGTSIFPEGGERSKYLIKYNVALKDNNMDTEIWIK